MFAKVGGSGGRGVCDSLDLLVHLKSQTEGNKSLDVNLIEVQKYTELSSK